MHEKRKSMTKNIRHRGTVIGIAGRQLVVSLNSSTQCDGCSLSAHCHADNIRLDHVLADCPEGTASYSIGQSVVVVMNSRQGLKASMVAFAYPLLLMVVLLFGFHIAGATDAIAAAAAIAGVAIYYVALYCTGKKWQQQFHVTVENTEN